MTLDPTTLIVINVANLLVMSLTLPIIMGHNLSPAARDARLSLILNGAAWIALVFSGFWRTQWPDMVLSSIAMGLLSASTWMIYMALHDWLGPRPLGRALAVISILMPVGYALNFDSYPIRVGWSNLLIALQLLIVARATLFPASPTYLATGGGLGRWRFVLFSCLFIMAWLTAARGILGAWFTELYPEFKAPTPVNLVALMAANVTLVMGNVAVLVAWREEAEQQLRTMIITDPLTRLLNRRGWSDQAANAVSQAHRHRLSLSLLMLDLDFFKNVNDTHGHEAGDMALQLFGRLLKRCQRGGDIAARLGGEEFCVLLSMSDVPAAQGFDRRLRTELAAAAPNELDFPLNFSAGLAVLEPNETLEALMARADAALYRAKNSGRGCMMQATAPTAT